MTISSTRAQLTIHHGRFGRPHIEVPPGVRTFAQKCGYVARKSGNVDGIDDTMAGVVSALPAGAQPIGALAGYTVGAALVAPVAWGATQNSRDKFGAYRSLLAEIVARQAPLIRSLEKDGAKPALLEELCDLSKECHDLVRHDRWQRVKSKVSPDASGFKALSQRFGELARSQIGNTSSPSTVHQMIEYERSERRRSIANLERLASLANAGGMNAMFGALFTGAGKSAAKVTVQHATDVGVKAGAAAAQQGLGLATSGVFAAGQLLQSLFGASRVLTGTQCRTMLQGELDALALLKDHLDTRTYDGLRQTVQRLLELNELIYVRSGALLSLGQLLMVGGSVTALVGGAATLGAAAVPGTALSVTGTVLTLAGVAGQVRGDVRKERFVGDPSAQAQRTMKKRDLAALIDRSGLNDAVTEVGELLAAYQKDVTLLKTLSLATRSIGAEQARIRPVAATSQARHARLQRAADTFGAIRNRTTLLSSDKAGLTDARKALGADFFQGSREEVEARIHAALLAVPESKALMADTAFQRILLYKTLRALRSDTHPEIKRFFGNEQLGAGKTVTPSMFARLADRVPRVRAEQVRQANELLLPRLRSDLKALRLDTAQHLTRLAEVMAELKRIDAAGRTPGEHGDDERLV